VSEISHRGGSGSRTIARHAREIIAVGVVPHARRQLC
jgi:hypothetical protein